MKSGRKVTAYDVADHYDEAYFDDLAARYRERSRFAKRRIENVFSLLPPVQHKTVIDIGCGMGTFTIECARRGAVAIGIDPAPAAVAAARRVADAEQVRSAFFIQADAVQLPLGDECSDVVLAADVAEHLDDQTLGGVLAEAARVLRPGGELVLYTPEQRHLFERLRDNNVLLSPDPSHIAVRSAEELARAVEKAGFRVELVSYLPSHLPLWNLLERGFQRWVPLLRRRIGVRASRA